MRWARCGFSKRSATSAASQSVRFYQASSSEIYGKVHETPQRETTPFHPRSPYACAKAFAFYQVVNYREAYGMHASNGILFNHESPRRGETFVTRKITRGLARILAGKDKQDLSRQSRRQARLGLCQGLRRGDVADAAAGHAGRLCRRHRPDMDRARFPRSRIQPCRTGLARLRRVRSALSAAERSRYLAGRPAARRATSSAGGRRQASTNWSR